MATEQELRVEDYRLAPSGEGPLADKWRDKPHRLIYDLCALLEARSSTSDYQRGVEDALKAVRGQRRIADDNKPHEYNQGWTHAIAYAERRVCALLPAGKPYRPLEIFEAGFSEPPVAEEE